MPRIAPRPYVGDLYAPLSHMIGDGTADTPVDPAMTGTWVDDVDARRLLAYQALSALAENSRRYWLPATMWDRPTELNSRGELVAIGRSAAEQYREYGGPQTLVEHTRALVLGDDQTIVVPDAAPLPDLDDGQEPTDDRRALEAQQAAAAVVEDWLTDWADRVQLRAKILDGEEDTIGRGDGVYVLGWSDNGRRPRLRVYEPGLFFPDWASIDSPEYIAAGWDDDDFPPILHLAWQVKRGDVDYLHRITYRMRRIGEATLNLDGTTSWPTHAYPWGDSGWVCTYAVAEWRLDRLRRDADLYRLTPADPGGTVVVAERDLGVDFPPIVHVPNDVPGGRRFGRSILLKVAQLLDDLGSGDTDLAINAELVASSPFVTTGVAGLTAQGGPGAHYELPEGATAGLVDTSRSLDALIKYDDHLADLLAVRSRIGDALLGRIKPNEVPSGYALRLGFAAANRLKEELRLVRDHKFALLLRMAVRMAQAAAVLPAGPTPAMYLELGASLPADRAATIEEVKALLSTKPPSISQLTAVRMLQAVGLPIEDAEAEVDQIRREDIEGANTLVDATGNPADAYDYLERAPAAAQPAPGAPPAPALPAPQL